ncbi:MAG TPA: O-methyltransferase [Candidatus Acidoferrales bacterium]|nr:O-methyltransferase [Candidatus Acidoferrales bacterium]
MKSSSFERINYTLRPKKQIERKILIEFFQQVSKHSREMDICKYHYIGMGSIFYYDFILFHKYLHIRRMTSIDDKINIKRFEFNKPYDFVTFQPQKTTDFFGENSLTDKVIIWLDYDYSLFRRLKDGTIQTTNILKDIDLITQSVKNKSFLIITINAGFPKQIKDQLTVISLFRKWMSREFKSGGEIDDEKGFPLVQNIILNFIEEKQKFNSTKFYKLFSFKYNDGAPMFTLVGVFDDSDAFQKSVVNERFVKIDDSIVDINVPILTYREKLYLDSRIEGLSEKNKALDDLKFKEELSKLEFELDDSGLIKSYLEFYPYYPQYYEGVI